MSDKIKNLCECDVEDKESLALFRIKRNEWKRCLLDDDYSVSRQISHLLWNDIVFRTFNNARKILLNEDSQEIGFNGPLSNLIDEGFFTLQVMAIRRLTDPNFYDPKKAVISLRRLLDDILNNTEIFTRENYICHDGTKYNNLTREENGINWSHWNIKHENFDRFALLSNSKRSRKDKLNSKYISSLISELNSCKDLRTYANKFIAHTSDNPGKDKLTTRQKGITLNKLDEAYESIIKVGSFLGSVILYEHQLGGVPVPQYDQIKNFDKSIIKSKNKKQLLEYWRDRESIVSSWENDIWPNVKA